ncbi:hypothetical protein [Parachryseolinea silvisoli]|uniref:hypothetical protein n=1 Tax=Parachryseolinea silvisoli TaxID=2873601 RepID=UPI002265A8C5|nr:hypothetical protein [Parachryseolinea silvisoli]MCD9018250.1 hypothetical protein [Parachryseolinea silvisoli]
MDIFGSAINRNMAILSKKESTSYSGVSVSKRIKSRAQDPFILKKVKEAEAFLNKHGLPAALTR